MPIEAIKIPQNVYVEDRIIGPVTLRQLIIIGIGAGIGYGIFATVQKAGVTNVIALGACWIPTVICAAFAFFKINDLSLFSIILLSVEGFNKPNIRYWSPHQGLSINLITKQTVKHLDEAKAKASTDIQRLTEITRQMEKRQQELNKLSLHDMPSAKNVTSINTQIEHNTKHGLYEHEPDTVDEPLPPVRKDTVKAIGLEKEKSIDSITDSVKAFDALQAFPKRS
jgi:hypothetical protein